MNKKVESMCYLFLIFLTGCMVGWIYDEIYYWITEGMLRNRGILYGPWLPIYGIGALGIYEMKPLKKNPVLLFIVCALITGIVEYIIGYIGIHFLDLRLWDYRGLFLNLDGIICFRSVVCFAVMGLIFHYFRAGCRANGKKGKSEECLGNLSDITYFVFDRLRFECVV